MVCAPFATARMPNPANRKLVLRSSRMLGSSSTIRILGPLGCAFMLTSV